MCPFVVLTLLNDGIPSKIAEKVVAPAEIGYEIYLCEMPDLSVRYNSSSRT